MSVSTTYSPSAPTGRTGQGSGIANREDLDSKLTLLDAAKFPLTMLCKRGPRAKSTLIEWPVDIYDDPNTDGVPEGEDVTAFEDAFSSVARLQGRVQHFRRSYRVSKEQQLSESAGPQDKLRAKAKKMIELKRDVESALASDNDATSQSAGVAAKMRGLDKWISTSPGSDVPADYTTPSGSIITSLTEITFNDVLRTLHDQNGEVNSLSSVNGSRVQQEIAEFTRTDNNASETVYHVHQSAESKKVTLSVKIYDSDFGFVRMVPANPKCQSNLKGFILNPNYLELRYFDEPKGYELEDQGGGPRGYVETFVTLAVRDPRAHGKVTLGS